MLTPLNFATKIVFGPSCRMLSRSDWSKPRTSDVMPTIAVMPMTTPRTVNAERSLLTRSVSSASVTTSPSSLAFIYSRLNASIGSSCAAREAG